MGRPLRGGRPHGRGGSSVSERELFLPPVGHRPRRALGQNFLTDPGIRARIVEAVPAVAGGSVLEIGPGRGALTEGLVARSRSLGEPLILVELDRDLAEAHRARWADEATVTVVESDILKVRLTDLVADPGELVVVGNIPYNITTPILFHLLERPRPREILLMVQREVADRILAPEGDGAYGALSVGVRSVARVERVLSVPAGAFHPRPKVDSTVVRITPIRPEPLTEGEEATLRRLTRALFQWRRKQLGKILREQPELALPRALTEAVAEAEGFALTDRPETLSPEQMVSLARRLAPELSTP
jgi:16S rRNA (adenine1518-N6/adenine1519-N6)-dimethyltransferase